MFRAPEARLSRAVLIGTSDYVHAEELPRLPAVGNNLADLRRALTDPGTGILDWDQCTVIDSPDSPASLLDRLAAAAGQAEDLLLVYYAGHGIRHPVREQLFLGVRQTSPRSLWGTGVPFDSIREVIEGSPARTRLLLLDCCYAGLAVSTMAPAGVDIQEVDVRGTAVIASSPRNERSHSPVGERHTAFTGEVIRLLTEGAPLRDAPLTVQQLFRSVSAALARRELPRPKGNLGDTSGDLLLRRERAADSPEEPGRVAAPDGMRLVATVEGRRLDAAAEEADAVVRPEPVPEVPGLQARVPEMPAPRVTAGPVPYVPPAPPSHEYIHGRPMPRSYYLGLIGSALLTGLLWLLTAYCAAYAAGSVLDAALRKQSLGPAVFFAVLALFFGGTLHYRRRLQLLRGPRRPSLVEVRPKLALRLFHTANLLLFALSPPLVLAAFAVALNSGDITFGLHFLVAEAIVGVVLLLRRLNRVYLP